MTAKEMFEELGYRIAYFQKDHTIHYLKTYKYDDAIIFYKRRKEIDIKAIINVNELKAINKQIEELGWNNE